MMQSIKSVMSGVLFVLKMIGLILVASILITVACVFFANTILYLQYANGQSFMNGNNTVANVTPILDLNDESRNASDLRFMADPYGEPKLTQDKLDVMFSEYRNFIGNQSE